MSVRLLPAGMSRQQQRKELRRELVASSRQVIELTAACAWPAPTADALVQRQRREHELRAAQEALLSAANQLARFERDGSPTQMALVALAVTCYRDSSRTLAELVASEQAALRASRVGGEPR